MNIIPYLLLKEQKAKLHTLPMSPRAKLLLTLHTQPKRTTALISRGTCGNKHKYTDTIEYNKKPQNTQIS